MDIKYRGKGIAKKLMSACEEKVKENSSFIKSDLILEASNAQVAAYHLYKKIGYSVIQHIDIPFMLGLGSVRVYRFVKSFEIVLKETRLR